MVLLHFLHIFLTNSLLLDNARSNSNITDTKLEREGSYITLFMNRSSENSSFISKDQSLYTKYTDIRIAGKLKIVNIKI